MKQERMIKKLNNLAIKYAPRDFDYSGTAAGGVFTDIYYGLRELAKYTDKGVLREDQLQHVEKLVKQIDHAYERFNTDPCFQKYVKKFSTFLSKVMEEKNSILEEIRRNNQLEVSQPGSGE